jgi:hypothetical protein
LSLTQKLGKLAVFVQALLKGYRKKMESRIQQKLDALHTAVFEILQEQKKEFIPGESLIPTGCGLYDHREISAV